MGFKILPASKMSEPPQFHFDMIQAALFFVPIREQNTGEESRIELHSAM